MGLRAVSPYNQINPMIVYLLQFVFHQTCDIMPFVPKVNGKEKAVKERRPIEKDNVREEDNVSLLSYSLLYSFFCTDFSFAGRE